MNTMGWSPGQTLGKNGRGLTKPIEGKILDRGKSEGLGYRPLKYRETQVSKKLVEVLKLKIEQVEGDNVSHKVDSVFEEEEIDKETLDGFKSEIKTQIFNFEVIGLVDTGSDITCISEEFWNDLKQKNAQIPMMPIKSFQIRTAVGHKSTEIRSLVLLPIKIGQFEIETGALIVPGLSSPLILGFDWLKMNEITISLNRNERGLLIKKSEEENSLIKFYERKIDSLGCNAEISRDRDDAGNLQELKIGTDLDKEEKRKLDSLLDKYKCLFSSKLGRANCYEHDIKMEPHVPIIKRTYPVPYAYREKVEEKLKEMEEQGIITRSATPYCSPLTFTLKSDGSLRVLLDAREINKFMIAETEKPPLQLDVMNSFHGAKFISVIDLNNAYFQIPISEDSRKYTGFSFNGKSYVYNVLPQGLKTSVGSFSRAMDVILGNEVRDYCVNYLDDLAIITTGSLDQHLEHVDTVLGKLKKAGLTCNLKKCEFLCKEVNMLGFIISTEGLRTDPEKVKSIQNFPTPKKIKQVRAFLGLCNFYRRFIPDYSHYAQPLCDLLKKEVGWKWEDDEQKAFEKIKSLFVDTVQLQHPDFKKPYYLQTDSSGIGMAGILYQVNDKGDKNILGFHSKALKGAQLNWTVTEQEFYSVISCLEKFETYLRGSKVIIQTDHKALIFVKNWKLYNARVTRWINYLEHFHYEIEHIKGKENIGADILSRYPPEGKVLQEEKEKLPEILYTEIKANKDLIAKLKDLSNLQKEDPEIKEIRERIENQIIQTDKIGRIAEKCTIENDILYFTSKDGKRIIYLPETLKEEIIKQTHIEMGHQGTYKVIKYIKDRFYWRDITGRVKKLIKTCHDCQITKSNTTKYVGPCRSIITEQIGDMVMVDLYGPLPTGMYGMNYILVIQDTFSKFVKFYALRKATARSVLGQVKKFFDIIKPKTILSDNGSQFASKLWKDSMKQEGVKVYYTTVRNPRPNTTERVNKELGRLFRTYCRTNHKGWVSVLPKLELLYNNTYHESTGFTPCEIMYGESNCLSFDEAISKKNDGMNVEDIREKAKENLQRAGEKRQRKFNRTYRLIQYQIGDLVKIRRLNKSEASKNITKKFEPLYEGPYAIARIPYENVYILVDPNTNKIRGKFNTIHLTRYYSSKKI